MIDALELEPDVAARRDAAPDDLMAESHVDLSDLLRRADGADHPVDCGRGTDAMPDAEPSSWSADDDLAELDSGQTLPALVAELAAAALDREARGAWKMRVHLHKTEANQRRHP